MELSSFLILIKLIFAHLVADFVFQSKKMVENKAEKKIDTHIYHSLIHSAAAYLVVAQWTLWYLPLIVFATHFLIDYWKATWQKLSKIRIFVIDQALHLVVILFLWFVIVGCGGVCELWEGLNFGQSSVWLYLTGALVLLKPTSLFIANFTERWREHDNAGLNNAGLCIGYFERMLIFMFVVNGWYEGIGFLLAAKSIFRFGELKNEDRKTTEYVLIGTLSSFTIAIFVALSVCYFR